MMTSDELRAEVNQLRTLRTGSQSLGRALKQEAAVKKEKESRPTGGAGKSIVNLDELLGSL
jgi:hypothetical protein